MSSLNRDKFVISVLVKNESGVLTRISGLFARRGFNIDSLSVGETQDKEISRITITVTGDDYIKDQITKQLEKLCDVIKVEIMDLQNTVTSELVLIKVSAKRGNRSEIMEAVTVFRASVIDLATDTLTVEITGEKSKIEAFIEYLKPYGITELCRTGITAIGRGNYILKN